MNICLVSGDGIGGQLLAFQCGKLLKDKNHSVTILVSARDEVFNPINFLFGKDYNIIQIPENYQTDLLSFKDLHYSVLQLVNRKFDEIYIVYPDLLFQHPRSFDFKRFGLNLQEIVKTKLLQNQRKSENIIYCALNTSTPEYKYPHVFNLVYGLAGDLPNYQIYFNNITKWAGKDINNGNFEKLPKNVLYFENQDFNESLEYLKKSCYCVCLDNGISHISYSMGVPRLLLDFRADSKPDNLMFRVRWREEDLFESVNLNIPFYTVAAIVKINLEIPQTSLLPRKIIENNLNLDWSRYLYFKY